MSVATSTRSRTRAAASTPANFATTSAISATTSRDFSGSLPAAPTDDRCWLRATYLRSLRPELSCARRGRAGSAQPATVLGGRRCNHTHATDCGAADARGDPRWRTELFSLRFGDVRGACRTQPSSKMRNACRYRLCCCGATRPHATLAQVRGSYRGLPSAVSATHTNGGGYHRSHNDGTQGRTLAE